MGAGGPGMSAEEQMTEVQLPLMDDLPEGIMLAGDEETVEVRLKSTTTMQTWLKCWMTPSLDLCPRTLVVRLMKTSLLVKIGKKLLPRA